MSEKKAKIIKKTAKQIKEERETRKLALEKVRKMEERRKQSEESQRQWDKEYEEKYGFTKKEYIDHLCNVERLNKQR